MAVVGDVRAGAARTEEGADESEGVGSQLGVVVWDGSDVPRLRSESSTSLEISAYDIADAFEQMWQKKRYNEIFFMIDTCQANTMYSKFYSPNILATGSSQIRENSYSYENDNDIGVAVIDSYTHHVLEFMEGIGKTSHKSIQDLVRAIGFEKIHSHPGVRSDLFRRPLRQTLVTDFFGGVAQAEILPSLLVPSDEVTSNMSKPLDIRPSAPNMSARLADPVEMYRTNDSSGEHRVAPTRTLDTAAIFNSYAEADRGPFSVAARAWASVALAGSLIAWVIRTSKQ
ncbi:uncharacterized protein PHACADRAFT_90842 [Phanerochaete carnosa HHB-10118-sp]|uniref:GPI-anchor transamidase n=1 Tax=Phanerochaete carnosa (strain HHB-10118-sp) TaxID=650164 RepID=K5WFU9_PHACS|nr:uncharacterized protein PHACADRAFT_90842 [Phanerochaete carnosa HHB-10118-sp]EKM57959.1 hypothetical protein PHACADRAFT_90842 [Phanerochaete carnosa HHB-10118-sp]